MRQNQAPEWQQAPLLPCTQRFKPRQKDLHRWEPSTGARFLGSLIPFVFDLQR